MRIDNKASRLLMVAVVGAGLVACQPEPDVTGQAASDRQDPANSMNQAPRQGFTGPRTIAPPAGSASEERLEEKQLPSSQAGETGTTGTTADPTMKPPGDTGYGTGQEKPQQ